MHSGAVRNHLLHGTAHHRSAASQLRDCSASMCQSRLVPPPVTDQRSPLRRARWEPRKCVPTALHVPATVVAPCLPPTETDAVHTGPHVHLST